MTRWRYRITTNDAEDVLALLQEPVSEVPPTIYCDDEGACYFDQGPNPFTRAIEQMLDEIGEEEWELVQIFFRPGQVIGFWKQPR